MNHIHGFTWHWRRIKYQWWALPLVLPCVLLPLVIAMNTHTLLGSGRIFLLYLPLSMMTALVMLFSWRALPGIALSLFLRYVVLFADWSGMLVILQFILPLVLSWGCYLIFVSRRAASSFTLQQPFFARIFWLILVNSTLFLLLYEMGLLLGFYDKAYRTGLPVEFWSTTTLINYQALMIGGITGIPFFYFLLRTATHPHFFRRLIPQYLAQCQQGVGKVEISLWLGMLVGLTWLLLSSNIQGGNLFNTSYTLTLILPVMLWGAVRFGFIFIVSVLAVLLVVLSSHFSRYIPLGIDKAETLAIISSSYVVSSVTILMLAVITTRQRMLYAKTQRLVYIDPVIQLPNLRAFRHDLRAQETSVITIISIPGLELLGRNYGVLLRMQYKQQLAVFLRQLLDENERVYHLSGFHIAIRLNHKSAVDKVAMLYQRAQTFRFLWHGMPLQPPLGISYTQVRAPFDNIYLLIGELITLAERSLATSRPERLQTQSVKVVQQIVKQNVSMINQLQYALDNDYFSLMAQPVVGTRGDTYYEILLRMKGDDHTLMTADQFMPVAREFGFTTRIDHWVIHAVFSFIDTHRTILPGLRFAINLTPDSVCRQHLAASVKRYLVRYNIQPWQIIFELSECGSLLNLEQANSTITQLQEMGCQIAIDDFGVGYENYACLKELNVDILKIDGSLIANILSSGLDHQVVSAICQLAKIKKMQVVAEHIEQEEIKEEVIKLGIDYLQGHLLGRPQPLETLLKRP